jgi:tetratricopeptide (TPR) repeat protein
MLQNNRINIWLSYVSYPVTTAVYFERALRKVHNVTTIGSTLPDRLIKSWQLENMKLPIKIQDIDTDLEPDLKQIAGAVSKNIYPDLFLWVESVYGFFPKNINALGIPTACYLIDSHLNLEWHLKWAANFDYVFIAQKEYIANFKSAGIKNVYWLPLGCDPEIHKGNTNKKLYEVGFVGSLNSIQTRRVELLKKVDATYKLAYKRCFWTDMSEFFANSKIVFNNAIKNDLNMRVFEVMSSGSFLLTDMTYNNGQAEMFKEGEDLGIYTDENILERIGHYLNYSDKREKIAKRGQAIAHKAHTYGHRMDEIINICINHAEETPSPEEWRERSLGGEKTRIQVSKELGDMKTENENKHSRSFVIPVLDMSPASPYNIIKLLDDLEGVAGDVIVIFNSLEMAQQLISHPRIDYYAVMSDNVGVSRAWNIGLNISQTEVTFILNSDLHIERETIEVLEKNLLELPDAAIVGPQGSFFDFNAMKDILYFDKGTFDKPMAVDGVSGFLFAVKTEYFNSGSLKFDNQYTPCYYEEWDIGLQCRLAGLKTYVVPTSSYEHEWSGSIRALSSIKYLKKEESLESILERNTKQFQYKWLCIYSTLEQKEDILESLWTVHANEVAERFIKLGSIEKAEEIYNLIVNRYPNCKSALANLGVIAFSNDEPEIALEYLNRVALIDPDYVFPMQKSENLKRKSKGEIEIICSEVFNENIDELLEKTDSADNKKYMSLPTGEHYKFLSYISKKYEDALFFDIGTNYGGSALALAANTNNKIVTYDIIPMSKIKGTIENIELRIGNALEDERLLKADVILLDTMHDGNFENLVYDFLVKNDYKGILLLDDINLNTAMRNFWLKIKEQKYDLSPIGHLTGTGLVDFSGRVKVI